MKFNFYYWFFVLHQIIYTFVYKTNKDAQVLGTENNPL